MDRYIVDYYTTKNWLDVPIVRVCIRDSTLEDEEDSRVFRVWNSVEVECPGIVEKFLKITLEMKVKKALKAQQKKANYMNADERTKNKKLKIMQEKINNMKVL